MVVMTEILLKILVITDLETSICLSGPKSWPPPNTKIWNIKKYTIPEVHIQGEQNEREQKQVFALF